MDGQPEVASEMACAADLSLAAAPSEASPNEAFALRGDGFFVGCNDTGQGRPEPPDKSVDLVFRQGERTWHLATVAADRDYAFHKRLVVPAAAEPGRATVIASGSSGQVTDGFTVRARTP